jgi:hypothetical protein
MYHRFSRDESESGFGLPLHITGAVKFFVQKALNFVWLAPNVASHHGVDQMVAIGHEKPRFTGFQMAFALKPAGPGILQ